ncbi:T9SS type A sorting domain-containing protein [candidate division WOR-3 bacterium]|nr:T9SS type A sorting domain-containing protein [candidate division WOR-3 bacterium]
MKSAALIVLAGVTLVPAISWDIEQVTFDQDAYHVAPQVIVNPEGYARIVYGEVNEEQEEAFLTLARQTSDGWDIDTMARLSETFAYDYEEFYYYPVFSIDLDTADEVYAAYFDFDATVEDWVTDIYLASADSEGFCDTSRLTDDTLFQVAPVVCVGENGEVSICYPEWEYFDSYEPYIKYGWLEDDSFYSMIVTKMVVQTDEVFPMDAALDADGLAHVFFTGFDACLWHAEPYKVDTLIDWDLEKLSGTISWCPSVIPEHSGGYTFFHLTCNSGEDLDSICYYTNKTGEWEAENIGQSYNMMFYTPFTSPVALNHLGHPATVWLAFDEGYMCSERTPTGWRDDPLPLSADEMTLSFQGGFFKISADGHGHLVYSEEDSRGFSQVFHARTAEPLEIGIAEAPFPRHQNPVLQIRGESVRLSLPEAGLINLEIFDASGRKVERFASGYYSTGEHSIPLNTSELSAGVYFVRAEANSQAASAKFVKTK